MSEPVVSLKNICFSYNGRMVLEDINLHVEKGTYLGIVGPNGGGKTTILKLILGLLTPQTGTIEVFGRQPNRQKKPVGYVPQQLQIHPGLPMTVLETVLLGLTTASSFGRCFGKKEKERAHSALESIDMGSYAQEPVSELSGGQKQRVFLARALVAEPELLILDEPTSNIDPHGSFCFFSFLEKLSKKMTIIVVSHNLSLVVSSINSVACVNRQLISNRESTLTEPMMQLLYGSHDAHQCAIGTYAMEEAEHLMRLRKP